VKRFRGTAAKIMSLDRHGMMGAFWGVKIRFLSIHARNIPGHLPSKPNLRQEPRRQQLKLIGTVEDSGELGEN
jgi:hypothetical protein